MTTLHTAAYGTWQPAFGQPVVASLTTPRWIPESASWPRCMAITPRWSYKKAPAEEFASRYLEQLNRYGPKMITAELERIGREHEADAVVVLCYEHEWTRCHRIQFAAWMIETTGVLVTELSMPPPQATLFDV